MAKRIWVRVRCESVAYPVFFNEKGSEAGFRKVLRHAGVLGKGAANRRVCIFVDRGFEKARPEAVQALRTIFPGNRSLVVRVEGSEKSKSLAVAERIIGEMIRFGMTRSDACIAMGGGVVGDLAGFVSSVFYRGIDVIHIPTTLLAMVDSSIGGKTAVNHAAGKNLIGAFHQPRAVIDVLEYVQSLPERDYKSGLGEVFKYAVGFSPRLFSYLERNHAKVLRRDAPALRRILAESVEIKAAIVGADERETRGLQGGAGMDRRLLNLGHTIGHGLEKAYGLPHGIAVAHGVVLAARLSTRLKMCPQGCYDRVVGLANRLELLTEAKYSMRKVMPYVKRDKKVTDGKLHFVFVRGVGRSVVRPVSFQNLLALENRNGQ